MVSRIILTTADFSANNIGRIVEVSDFTKKVLAKQTQYGEDSVEALALDTFLSQLNDGGFIGGSNPLIKSMFIPALASEHDELLYDIATLDGNGYPTNQMGSAESSAASGSEVYETVADSTSGKNIAIRHSAVNDESLFGTSMFDGEVGNAYPSHSYVFFGNIPNAQTFGTGTMIFQNGALNYKVKIMCGNTQLVYANQDTTNASIGVTLDNDVYGFLGLSLSNDDGNYSWAGLSDIATFGTSSQSGDQWNKVVIQNEAHKYKIGQYYSAEGRRAKLSLLIFADYINPTKMAELRGYVLPLMAALHVPFSND